MAERRGNIWIAIAAIGTLLGGAAAFLAVLRDGSAVAPVETTPTATYSESLSCWGQAERVRYAAHYFRRFGYEGDVALEQLVARMDQVSESAEASAMRLASEEGKTPYDVQMEYLSVGPTVVVRLDPNYRPPDPPRPDPASVREDAEQVLRICRHFEIN